MELTIFAQWLNEAFASFDHSILSGMHQFAFDTYGAFTNIFKLITLTGEKGIIFFIAAIILILFKKTRKTGIALFGAVCCGALITNIILKDFIARPRPFTDVYSDFHLWWGAIGSPAESGFSFPSGHVTSAMAGMTVLFFAGSKKYSWVSFVYVAFMCLSRMYLMAHYPSDVIAGLVIGLFSAIIALLITNQIYRVLNKYSDNKFFSLIINFDIRKLINKKSLA